MRKTILILFLTILMMSCATAPPRQGLQIEKSLPDTWTAQDGVLADTSLINAQWWTAFKSPQLNQLVEEAFQKNLSLKMAAANLDAASEQAKIAGASLAPSLSGGFNGARNKQNFIGLPIPGMGDEILTSTSTNLGVSMNLSWELDLWGRLSAERSRAGATFQAVQADYMGAQLSLAAQVTKAWIAALTARRQLDLSQATVKNWKLASEQVYKRYISGLAGSIEYRLSLSSLNAAKAVNSQRQMQYDSTKRQLELLLARYPSASIDLSGDLPDVQNSIPAGLPAELISRRPDLASAERRLASSLMGVKVAKRSLYPQISLTSSTGTSSNELADLTNPDFSVFSIAGNILQPLFQGGRLRANVRLTEAQAKIAAADYEQSVLKALAEVEAALSNEEHLEANEEALKEASEQGKAARILAEEQYASGISTFLTMLEAERQAFDTESRLLDAKQARLNGRIDLILALGGGFEWEQPEYLKVEHTH